MTTSDFITKLINSTLKNKIRWKVTCISNKSEELAELEYIFTTFVSGSEGKYIITVSSNEKEYIKIVINDEIHMIDDGNTELFGKKHDLINLLIKNNKKLEMEMFNNISKLI